jgi:hypothetical protein
VYQLTGQYIFARRRPDATTTDDESKHGDTTRARVGCGGGNLVGVENADIVTRANLPHTVDCASPQGFAGGWPGMFSSVVVLFGGGA